MNKKQFKIFTKTNKLNQLIRINENYPRRTVTYTLSDGHNNFSCKLTAKTFISLIEDKTLILKSKDKINGYTYRYVYEVV